jgi:acyl-CoA synthetase (AMP-forming)/AMP-acid ligase II
LLDLLRGLSGPLTDLIEPGDRVAVWGPNSIDWAIAAFAVLFVGGTVVPLNSRYTTPEAAHIVTRAGCRAIFADHTFLGRRLALEATRMSPGVPVIGMGAGEADDVVGWRTLLDTGAVAGGQVNARLRKLTPDHISYVQFTSGTTGRPKGAMLRHGAMVRSTVDWARFVSLRSSDRYPIIAPFSHIGGHKTGLLASFTVGCAARPIATLDLHRLIETIDGGDATVLQGPPTLFQDLVSWAREERRRFSTLRVAVTGAATIAPALIRDMIGVLGVENVFTSYGLSETTGMSTITRAGDPVEVVAETSGRPAPGIEVGIVDDFGQTLPSGRAGEIVVRGPNVMAGYLDDPAATDAAIRRGWLHTGDIGWLGDDGYLRVVDRVKDMIIVGGFNAYPAEIERALLEHADVEEAAVIGIPDERMGEVPAAFVVRRGDSELSAESLQSFCRERLANFKRPRAFWFVNTLPVNAAGKVAKTELRVRAAAQAASA